MICPYCEFNNHIKNLDDFHHGESATISCDNCKQLFDVVCDVTIAFHVSKHVEKQRTPPDWIHDQRTAHLTKYQEVYVTDDGRIISHEGFLQCQHFSLDNEAWIILPQIVLSDGKFVLSSDLPKCDQ